MTTFRLRHFIRAGYRVLIAKQIEGLAQDLVAEAASRPYVTSLIPTADDRALWNVVLELVEIVLNRRGYIIVHRNHARD